MKKFIYTGFTSCHTSIKIKGESVDFSFHQNEKYELPENDSFVKSLQAQGLLSPLSPKSPENNPISKKKLTK